MIVKMGYKMSNIIDALLLFARVRKATIRPEPIHMAPLVESALQRLQQAIEAEKAMIRELKKARKFVR
jgi:signal transduction histidine kinase